jgi:hypothetical protein
MVCFRIFFTTMKKSIDLNLQHENVLNHFISSVHHVDLLESDQLAYFGFFYSTFLLQ